MLSVLRASETTASTQGNSTATVNLATLKQRLKLLVSRDKENLATTYNQALTDTEGSAQERQTVALLQMGNDVFASAIEKKLVPASLSLSDRRQLNVCIRTEIRAHLSTQGIIIFL